MALLDWIRGKQKPASPAAEAKASLRPKLEPAKPMPQPSKANSAPSVETVATSDWAGRIVNYARKVSRELDQAHVPTWPDQNFWVIAADVEEATWHVPVTNKFARERGWMREGQCAGSALVLFTDGTLAHASFYGHFDFNQPALSFEVKDGNIESWNKHTWGSSNMASWRQGSGNFGRVSGASRQESWIGQWNHKWAEDKPPGLGTSLALKKFLENRKTQFPRYY